MAGGGSRGAGSPTPPTTISRWRGLANETCGRTTVTIRPGASAQNPNQLLAAQPARHARCTKKAPAGWPRRGSSAQLVTRASRNDVAVDADAQAVVVLILELVEGARLGGVAQSGIGHCPARCRLQLLVDHIEAHVEP